MNYHAKRKLIEHSTYIVLALIICSIACLTIVAFVSAKRPKDKIEPPTPDTLPSEVPGESQEKEEDASLLPTDPEEPDQSTSSEDEPVYVLPTDGYVQKEFSMDLPVWSLTMEDYRTHSGIDVSAACGSAVYAMTGGVISDISDHPLMGYTITILQDDGNVAKYQNLAEEMPEGITAGATVSAGQIIASVGDSALLEQCETDHLHVEILSPEGEHINPEILLDFSHKDPIDVGNE